MKHQEIKRCHECGRLYDGMECPECGWYAQEYADPEEYEEPDEIEELLAELDAGLIDDLLYEED